MRAYAPRRSKLVGATGCTLRAATTGRNPDPKQSPRQALQTQWPSDPPRTFSCSWRSPGGLILSIVVLVVAPARGSDTCTVDDLDALDDAGPAWLAGGAEDAYETPADSNALSLVSCSPPSRAVLVVRALLTAWVGLAEAWVPKWMYVVLCLFPPAFVAGYHAATDSQGAAYAALARDVLARERASDFDKREEPGVVQQKDGFRRVRSNGDLRRRAGGLPRSSSGSNLRARFRRHQR